MRRNHAHTESGQSVWGRRKSKHEVWRQGKAGFILKKERKLRFWEQCEWRVQWLQMEAGEVLRPREGVEDFIRCVEGSCWRFSWNEWHGLVCFWLIFLASMWRVDWKGWEWKWGWTTQEAIVIVWIEMANSAGDGDGMDHGGGSGNGERWADRRYILELELMSWGRVGLVLRETRSSVAHCASPWSKCGRCWHQEMPA